MARKKKTLEERFWPKVEKRGPEECWEWKRARTGNQYGAIGTGETRPPNTTVVIPAHHAAFLLHHGRLPEKGKVLRHTCDNMVCCNPAHLVEGTHADNMRDMAERGRVRRHVLNEVHKDEIVRRRKTYGHSHSRLARDFGVQTSTISRLLKRREH